MAPISKTFAPPVILLCAPAGWFQESLRVLVSGMPFNVIGPVAEARSVLALLQAWHPGVAVVDWDLAEEERQPIVQTLQRDWPEVRRVAVVDNASQMAEAKTQGVETVLLRGFRLDEFRAAVIAPLPGPGHLPVRDG
jgi:DNA-binding NarL/FixJ family response regulator